MNSGKRLGVSVLATGGLLGVGLTLVTASEGLPGQVTGLRIIPVSNAAITAPILALQGRVQSIAGPVLTIRADGGDRTFMMDDNTDVRERGASRASGVVSGFSRTVSGIPITDLVRAGDIVRVAYRDLNGSMRVSEIQITGRNTIAAR